jgi:hypothetical protein
MLLALLGSELEELMLAVLVNSVPVGEFEGICATRVNAALAPAAKVALVQVIVPPSPASGALQLKAGPLSCVRETKVISPGSVSPRVMLEALSGPVLEIVML